MKGWDIAMKRLATTAAVLAAFAGTLYAGPTADANAPLVCPVMKYKLASKKAAVAQATYKGKTYYLCCTRCKLAFAKNPAKYAKK